jgi:ribosome-binding protein aMBF1 (putative translation factor)
MNEKSDDERDLRARQKLEAFGEPLARAIGVFIRELTDTKTPERGKPSSGPATSGPTTKNEAVWSRMLSEDERSRIRMEGEPAILALFAENETDAVQAQRFREAAERARANPVPRLSLTGFSAAKEGSSAVEVEEGSSAAEEGMTRRLLELCRQRGLSQRSLAARLEVSPSVVSRIFSQPERSKVSTLRRIAAVLEVPLSRLFSET